MLLAEAWVRTASTSGGEFDVDELPFAYGALQALRERLVENEMDRVLLERTVALVRDGVATTGEGKQPSKAIRVAINSRPLAGAGRVEDTLNLLGHAARNIVKLVSTLTDREPEEIYRKAGILLLLTAKSIASKPLPCAQTCAKLGQICDDQTRFARKAVARRSKG